ncbi:hypothetical protein BMF94_1540 [Rhodotorula taiwanensis]|uniref:Uncharacterized protein n=1 Tax=Rhodotorula taiwanensis TaxID=741276 RepID=A0A2S5BF63_9BASI|nr:hypothetical protein BMF94_1540 [Rhodotorula taiwanensis]
MPGGQAPNVVQQPPTDRRTRPESTISSFSLSRTFTRSSRTPQTDTCLHLPTVFRCSGSLAVPRCVPAAEAWKEDQVHRIQAVVRQHPDRGREGVRLGVVRRLPERPPAQLAAVRRVRL